MTDKGKMEMLQGLVNRKRAHVARKKALNEQIKENILAIENEIDNDGDLAKAKRALLKERRLLEERKDLNAKIHQLRNALEEIILGEGKYDNTQLDFDDFVNAVESGELSEADEEEEEEETEE